MQAAKLAPMHMVNWEDAQGADMALVACRKWLKAHKDTPVREERCPAEEVPRQSGRYRGGLHPFPHVQQLGPEQGTVVHSTTPKGEMEGVLAFLVPSSQHTAALNSIYMTQATRVSKEHWLWHRNVLVANDGGRLQGPGKGVPLVSCV